MVRTFQRIKGEPDVRTIGQNIEKMKEKDEELHEEGEKYWRDKEALEKKIDIVDELPLKPEEKAEILRRLKEQLCDLQKSYEKIREEREKIQEQQKEEIEKYESGIDELSQTTENIKDMRFETNSVDTTTIVDALDEKKIAFEKQKAEAQKQLELQMEQAKRQYREMQKSRFK